MCEGEGALCEHPFLAESLPLERCLGGLLAFRVEEAVELLAVSLFVKGLRMPEEGCVNKGIYICEYMYIYVYLSIYLSICLSIYIYIYTHTYKHIYVYKFTSSSSFSSCLVEKPGSRPLYIYIHTHTHTHIYIYLYIYLHMYINIPRRGASLAAWWRSRAVCHAARPPCPPWSLGGRARSSP